MKNLLITSSLFLLFCSAASAQTKIAAKDASKHLNETVTISDKIYSTKLIGNTNMVLLDMGGEHPNQYLTVVIKGEDISKFNSKPEEYYKGREVTVTGKLIDYHGKPEIIVDSPDELKLNMNDGIIKQPIKTGN
jgi:DNA/RNA endonuclease YhcR with UshA esterase domain